MQIELSHLIGFSNDSTTPIVQKESDRTKTNSKNSKVAPAEAEAIMVDSIVLSQFQSALNLVGTFPPNRDESASNIVSSVAFRWRIQTQMKALFPRWSSFIQSCSIHPASAALEEVPYKNVRGGRKAKFLPVAGELVDLGGWGENDESNFRIAQNRELPRFLRQTVPTFGQGHLTVYRVLDALQLHPSPSHLIADVLISLANEADRHSFRMKGSLPSGHMYAYLW
eukprot:Gb_38924 [translate_table: standard]